MPKFIVTGSVIATTYIGEYEAETKEEAEEMAWNDAGVSVCHQCARDVEEPEINELYIEEVKE